MFQRCLSGAWTTPSYPLHTGVPVWLLFLAPVPAWNIWNLSTKPTPIQTQVAYWCHIAWRSSSAVAMAGMLGYKNLYFCQDLAIAVESDPTANRSNRLVTELLNHEQLIAQAWIMALRHCDHEFRQKVVAFAGFWKASPSALLWIAVTGVSTKYNTITISRPNEPPSKPYQNGRW